MHDHPMLSKTLEIADYTTLQEELVIVDRSFEKDSPQHPARRWEYAMALSALQYWYAYQQELGVQIGGPIYDVGGSGSPFFRMPDPYQVLVVDPKELHGKDLLAFLRDGPRLGGAVFCLSVIEHVTELATEEFVYHLSCLTAPGGLCFLTMDLGQPCNRDQYHFHWMREHIYSPLKHIGLRSMFERHGFAPFGGWGGPSITSPIAYHGPQVYDYTFASLALRKRA